MLTRWLALSGDWLLPSDAARLFRAMDSGKVHFTAPPDFGFRI
jgi:hypothetical protein